MAKSIETTPEEPEAAPKPPPSRPINGDASAAVVAHGGMPGEARTVVDLRPPAPSVQELARKREADGKWARQNLPHNRQPKPQPGDSAPLTFGDRATEEAWHKQCREARRKQIARGVLFAVAPKRQVWANERWAQAGEELSIRDVGTPARMQRLINMGAVLEASPNEIEHYQRTHGGGDDPGPVAA